MPSDTPKRDLTPGPIPKFTKPNPNLSDDPGAPSYPAPYKSNPANPIRSFDFDQKDSKT